MSHAPTQPVSNDDERSFWQKVRQGEQHWAWKFGFRVAICVLDIVGIGCAAWLVTSALNRVNGNFAYGYYFESTSLIASLAVLTASFIWCASVIAIYFLRRPPSPIHPGICVGADLIFWLAFIVTALFAIGGIFSVAYYFSDPSYLDDPSYSSSYDGHYYLAANGTWVYKITYVSNPCDYDYNAKGCHYNYTTGEYTTNSTQKVHRDCTPYFTSCAQQDRYINQLYQEHDTLLGTEITVAAVQWLNVLFHFILFVWACVDTHRYNKRTKMGYTQEIAEKVIRDMESRGLITVHGTAAGRMERAEVSQVSQQPVGGGQSRAVPEIVVAGPSSRGGGEDEIGQAR